MRDKSLDHVHYIDRDGNSWVKLSEYKKARDEIRLATNALARIHNEIPTNWLDRLLTGPERVDLSECNGLQVEQLLRKLKERVRLEAEKTLTRVSDRETPPKPECPPNIEFREDEVGVIERAANRQEHRKCKICDEYESRCVCESGPVEVYTPAVDDQCQHEWIIGTTESELHLIGTCALCGVPRPDGLTPTWTDIPPTEPGYYWWRQGDRIEPCEIRAVADTLEAWFIGESDPLIDWQWQPDWRWADMQFPSVATNQKTVVIGRDFHDDGEPTFRVEEADDD